MAIVVRGTETGFELRVLIQWRALVGLVRSLIFTVAALIVLVSTPAGQAVVAWLGW